MKRLAALMVILATTLLAGGVTPSAHAAAAGEGAKGKYQIVIQVTENNPQIWNLALNNAFAFQRNIGKDNSEIEIVAIGPGLNMLKSESKVTDRIG